MLTDKVFRMLIAFLLESGGNAVPMLKSEINLTEQDVTEFEDAVRTIIAGYLASDEDTQQMIFSLGLDSGLLVSGAGAPEVSAQRLRASSP